MNNLTFVTFTHSDYKDIWPIMVDGIEQSNLNFKKIFATNKNENSTKICQIYDQQVEYDDNLTYPQKIVKILEYVKTPYVFFVHDIDVVIKIDLIKLNKLLELIIENNIDRCSFGCFKKQNTAVCFINLIFKFCFKI
jgi:hypothetical protein